MIILLSGTVSGWSQVTIGSNAPPIEGMLLDLKERDTNGLFNSDKGVLLPRVQLENLNSLVPLSNTVNDTEKLTYKGTIVYNMKQNDGFNEGIYYWDGTNWMAMVTQIPKIENTIQFVNLTSSVTSASDRGNKFPFDKDIIIPEDGSYAFSFRLYGEFPRLATLNDGFDDVSTYRIALHVDRDSDPLEVATIKLYQRRPPYLANNHVINLTYSTTLAAHLIKGDRVSFYFIYDNKSAYGVPDIHWVLNSGSTEANRTSMIWWKL